MSCVPAPTPPNWVSASSTKITAFCNASSTRRSLSNTTSVCPNHWLRMFLSTNTGRPSSAATASIKNVLPLPIAPATAAPGNAASPLALKRGMSSSFRNVLRSENPTTSSRECSGFLNSITSSPSCARINSSTLPITPAGVSGSPQWAAPASN